MKAKIEESTDWTDVNHDSDCIGLLKIIKKIAHNTEDQNNPTLSLIEATQRIYDLRQNDHQSPMDVITSLGGCIYQPPMLESVSQRKYRKSYKTLTDAQKAEVETLADELTRATLFIHNSNPKKCLQLKNKLYNDHVQGQTDT
jgi:hypothetical protein